MTVAVLRIVIAEERAGSPSEPKPTASPTAPPTRDPEPTYPGGSARDVRHGLDAAAAGRELAFVKPQYLRAARRPR